MIFRDARRDEVARIVALLADDELGAARETGVDDAYLSAFDDIAATTGTPASGSSARSARMPTASASLAASAALTLMKAPSSPFSFAILSRWQATT